MHVLRLILLSLVLCAPGSAQQFPETSSSSLGLTKSKDAPPTPEPGLTFREIMAAQILLDRMNIAPNCIDGELGSRSRFALKEWQRIKGYKATGELNVATLEVMGDVATVFTSYVVTEADHDSLGLIPNTWLEKSRKKSLSHESIQELVAEKFHASQAGLKKLNAHIKKWPNPPVGTVLTVPNVNGFTLPVAARLDINLSDKLLRAYDAQGTLVAQFPCSIARRPEKRPVGQLKVVSTLENPYYIFDPANFPESEEAQMLARKLTLKPGPNNPVGLVWIALNRKGYGIHGSPHPEEISRTESHGCFRLSNWNALKLVKMVKKGVPVKVSYGPDKDKK